MILALLKIIIAKILYLIYHFNLAILFQEIRYKLNLTAQRLFRVSV